MTRHSQIDTLILVVYRPKDSVAAIASLNIISSLLGIKTKLLVLNKDIQAQLDEAIDTDTWIKLKGSNRNQEFSGWQEGVDYLLKNQVRHQAILFANDTVGRHYRGSHLDKCNLKKLLRHWQYVEGKQMIGISHFTEYPMILDGQDISQWIFTMIFCLSSRALHELDYQIDYTECAERMLSHEQDGVSILNETTPPALKKHIECWLLEGGWHGSKVPPLSDSDQQLLQLKAKCILCEKLLASKVKQKKIKLIGIKEAHAEQNLCELVYAFVKRWRTLKAKLIHTIRADHSILM